MPDQEHGHIAGDDERGHADAMFVRRLDDAPHNQYAKTKDQGFGK
jgi:hypothetical protein